MGRSRVARSAAVRLLVRLLRAREGVGATEFALVLPILVGIVAVIGSAGSQMWARMQVENAARAGAAYAALHGLDRAGIEAAVGAATGLGSVTASPPPLLSCGCPDEARGVVATACGARCPNGADVGRYVTVHARVAYAVPVPLPGQGREVTLTGTATARID